MEILEILKDTVKKLGGTIGTLSIESEDGTVLITVKMDQKESPEEDPQKYSLVCKTCGMTFLSDNPKARTCPECKKKARDKAMAKYKSKQAEKDKVSEVAKEIVRLGEDNA